MYACRPAPEDADKWAGQPPKGSRPARLASGAASSSSASASLRMRQGAHAADVLTHARERTQCCASRSRTSTRAPRPPPPPAVAWWCPTRNARGWGSRRPGAGASPATPSCPRLWRQHAAAMHVSDTLAAARKQAKPSGRTARVAASKFAPRLSRAAQRRLERPVPQRVVARHFGADGGGADDGVVTVSFGRRERFDAREALFQAAAGMGGVSAALAKCAGQRHARRAVVCTAWRRRRCPPQSQPRSRPRRWPPGVFSCCVRARKKKLCRRTPNATRTAGTLPRLNHAVCAVVADGVQVVALPGHVGGAASC
jgi:hypothetical protein